MPKFPDEEAAGPHYDTDPQRQLGSTGETLLDRQIREAVEEGRFDNLPHQGKPLPNDENPYAAEWGLAFHVLKNAGFAPPWIEADKEVRALLGRRDALLARAATGPAPSEITRRRDRSALEQLVAEANAWIARVNAEAPSTRQHRYPLTLADELRRYDEVCRRVPETGEEHYSA
jgi:DnaJ homolog subfamily C member 28